jgi:hypothetical protein
MQPRERLAGTKDIILEQIGERGIMLPELINRGLDAIDRLRYFMTLLRHAYAYAERPNQQTPDLRAEREAGGVADASFDDVVAASRMVSPGVVAIPGAASIIEHVFADARRMLEPLASAATSRLDLADRVSLYTRRLDDLVARAPSCTDDLVPAAAIETLTKLPSNGHDSLHQLVMDMNWELNRLQASVEMELVDGAHAYGLDDADRRLLRAFTRGLHETAALKFDHSGLETTATRDGDRLTIQNDLGVADGHVVLLRVAGLTATLVYTDLHPSRTKFLQSLLERDHLSWSSNAAASGFEISTGIYTAETAEQIERFLTFVGSRLVFLLDWNRARKRLTRFIRKSDAIDLLKWAADNNIGHAAFLQAGDIRLVRSALDRAAPSQVAYGARLDEILGREAANRFLMAVLRIASHGLTRGSSPRLIDDEVEAELLTYLQRSDRSLLGVATDHAMVVSAMAEWIRHAVDQMKLHHPVDAAAAAAQLRSWKGESEAIVRRGNRSPDLMDHRSDLRRLLSEGGRVVKGLEDASFMLTLMPPTLDAGVLDLLDQLAELASAATREYLRCLEDARELSRSPVRQDLERFLVTVDRLATIEGSCDEAERAIRGRLLRGGAADFREVYLVSELTRKLDRAIDAVVFSGLLVRDYILSVAPGA